MNFKRLCLVAVQAIDLGFMPAAALANTTNQVTYEATVPGSCDYSFQNGADETVTLTYDSVAQTLTGTTGTVGITCNFDASATLSAITTVNEPVGVSTSFALALNNGSSDLISTDGTSASSSTNLGLTNGVETAFTMPLTVSDADTLGSYEYTVVLTVLDGAG